jgi:ParB family chromosome partitioning protein
MENKNEPMEVMPMQKESTNKQPNTMDMPLNGQKGEATEAIEIVRQIPVEQLHPFKNHPFKVLDDDAMQQSVESIRQYGVMAPLIARPREDGGYEIISGHRRKYAAEQAGLKTLPVIVRPMDDNAAVILMVDSNLQREGLLPSERAFAYKMKMEAIKHQGKRTDLTSGQVGQKSESSLSSKLIAQQTGDSSRNVHRYIRLTYLIPELLEMVDQKKIAFNPAVELSYLTEAEQKDFMEAMGDCQNAPSLSQAQRIKRLSREGQCTYEAMFVIMGEAKKDELDKVTISNDVLRQYFPRSYTPRQMQDTIIKLLQQWQRKRQREQSR